MTAIRPATINDIDALESLENRVFDADRISRRSFRTLIERKTAATLVSEAAGKVTGYAMVLFRDGTAIARLYSLAVDPDTAAKGTGTALLKAAETAAFDRDRVVMRLEVREDNARAIALYARAGYRRIGKYLDYYADHADALRFEKLLKGGNPPVTDVPYYKQVEDFTCGPACLMMAMAHFQPGFTPDHVTEIRLWREATMVFMMSGLGGCGPRGLAVAAHEHGLSASIILSEKGPLFMQSVRSEEKRRVMQVAQQDFTERVARYRIPVKMRPLALSDIRKALADGRLAVVLVSGYQFFGQKVPHWVLVIGDDGHHLVIHDPWVEEEAGETVADAANILVPYEHFMRMARFGKENLRAAVILGKKG